MKGRLHYIDVIKGILILLVVFGHISWQANVTGVTNDVFAIVGRIGFFYSPFYMAAFFAVTGYCTNFDKPYKQYLWTDIKTLLFPSISLCVVAVVIRFVMMGEWDFSWVSPSRVARFGSLHWFLPALFWAKQIHFLLHKLNQYLLFGIYLILAVVGFMLYRFILEYWWINHGLMFVVFLQLGAYIKKHNIKYEKMCGLFYLLYVSLMQFISGHVPYIVSETHLRVFEIPLFIISSILGTIGIFYVGKKINCNKILEFLGRNSIVIYCLHFTIMNDFYRMFVDSLNTFNIYQSIFSLFLMCGIILSICSIVAWILNLKFKWVLGKF